MIGRENRDRQYQGAKHPAEHRGRERGAERARAFAFLGHGKSVDHGGLRVRCSRDAHQHRWKGVRGGERRNEADHHGQRVRRVHSEDERQQDRQARYAAEPWQDAHDKPEDDAPEKENEVRRLDELKECG